MTEDRPKYIAQASDVPDSLKPFIRAYRLLCMEHGVFIVCEGEALELEPVPPEGLGSAWGIGTEKPSFLWKASNDV